MYCRSEIGEKGKREKQIFNPPTEEKNYRNFLASCRNVIFTFFVYFSVKAESTKLLSSSGALSILNVLKVLEDDCEWIRWWLADRLESNWVVSYRKFMELINKIKKAFCIESNKIKSKSSWRWLNYFIAGMKWKVEKSYYIYWIWLGFAQRLCYHRNCLFGVNVKRLMISSVNRSIQAKNFYWLSPDLR